MMNRTDLAEMMLPRLEDQAARMSAEFATPGRIASAVLDDLLDAEVAAEIHARFPDAGRMTLKRSIKENKHVAAQMNACDPLVEEAVFAFQDPRIVSVIGAITGLTGLEPDADLYAGGISAMGRGAYLRPHIDNSHDADRRRYRVLNLLYYVTPDWREGLGGSLQLWDQGLHHAPRTIGARFNRLALMATNRTSWHSVNEVRGDGRRCCVSNYYFSRTSPEAQPYFHATSFRGETAGAGDLVMAADNLARTAILKLLPGVYRNPHRYQK